MAENLEFQSWLTIKISDILGFPAGEDLIKYILSLENARDIQEYFTALLDTSNADTKKFIDEFFKRWSPHIENCTVYKRNDEALPLGTIKKHVQVVKTLSRKSPKISPQASISLDTNTAQKEEFLSSENISNKTPFKRRNMKFVPLYSADGKLKTDTALIPGRHACQCLAQKHKLICNCMECGRIVCEQEGSGPCLFCGNLVCSQEELEIISRDSKKSKKLMEKLLGQTAVDLGLQSALAQKEKLLEFDKNCSKRTKVIDDEADHFSTDSRWISKKLKDTASKREEQLREKRFASRLERKIKLDFAGREVTQSQEDYDIDVYGDLEEDEEFKDSDEWRSASIDKKMEMNPLVDPRINILPLKFQSDCFKGNVTEFLKKQHDDVRASLRLQDKQLQEMVDNGMCLSMHQPWASLLVYGIKKLEGRGWYTAHRGRLWIAATAKIPDQETIDGIENQYRQFLPDEVFPKDYPSACLLGCVNVVDCLTNEEYFRNNPHNMEESDSEYLFVCDNPQQLRLKFSIKGQHKIYKLESHILAAARKSIKHS